jgi:hypothetical protein
LLAVTRSASYTLQDDVFDGFLWRTGGFRSDVGAVLLIFHSLYKEFALYTLHYVLPPEKALLLTEKLSDIRLAITEKFYIEYLLQYGWREHFITFAGIS